MKHGYKTALVRLTLGMLLTLSAHADQWVVLESSWAQLAVGSEIDGAKPLSLPEGAVVMLVSEAGVVLDYKGPATASPDEDARAFKARDMFGAAGVVGATRGEKRSAPTYQVVREGGATLVMAGASHGLTPGSRLRLVSDPAVVVEATDCGLARCRLQGASLADGATVELLALNQALPLRVLATGNTATLLNSVLGSGIQRVELELVSSTASAFDVAAMLSGGDLYISTPENWNGSTDPVRQRVIRGAQRDPVMVADALAELAVPAWYLRLANEVEQPLTQDSVEILRGVNADVPIRSGDIPVLRNGEMLRVSLNAPEADTTYRAYYIDSSLDVAPIFPDLLGALPTVRAKRQARFELEMDASERAGVEHLVVFYEARGDDGQETHGGGVFSWRLEH